MNFKIFTDTTCGLPTQIINEYDLGIISLPYIKNGEAILNDQTDNENYLKGFYSSLRLKEPLSTACANEADFINGFTPTLENGQDILYVGFSSGLSSNYKCSENAIKELKERFPERTIIGVDSLLASIGQGLLVFTACQLRKQGLSMQEVADTLNDKKFNVNSLFTVKDLSYLARGGRIGKMTSVIATVIDVKPLMYVNNEGKLLSYGKVFGRRRSILSLADKLAKTIIDPEEQTIFICHGDCEEDAKLLTSLITAKVKVKEVVYNYLDPVIGVHSGPDTLAVFYYGSNREQTVCAFADEKLTQGQTVKQL